MSNGRWWVLLLLSAVFSMHGVQCLDGDGPVMSAHAASASTWASDLTTGSAATEHTGDPAWMAHADPAGTGLAALGTASGGGHPEGSMDHLWTVCLAVLSAGFAVWLAVRLARPLIAVLLRPGAIGRWAAAIHARPCRPPDFYALCVLRT